MLSEVEFSILDHNHSSESKSSVSRQGMGANRLKHSRTRITSGKKKNMNKIAQIGMTEDDTESYQVNNFICKENVSLKSIGEGLFLNDQL
jgi:hypothetical protein